MSTLVHVKDKMQCCTYELTAPYAQLADGFNPLVTPKAMLELGVFGGKYMTDCTDEFPSDWFVDAKLSPLKYDESLNRFGVRASQTLKTWLKNGWIHPHDPRGWFQWYCRYYMGRRIEKYDEWQIKRWRGMKRHVSRLLNNYEYYNAQEGKKMRQALLHWGILADGTFTPQQLLNIFE